MKAVKLFGVVGIALFLSFVLALGTNAQSNASVIFRFHKSRLIANSADVQAIKIVIPYENPRDIDFLSVEINRNHPESPARGRFRFTPARGFYEHGDNIATGNAFVTLLPTNSSNPTSGSQYYVNQKAHTATFIIRWTADPTYGDVLDNDIDYIYTASAQNFSSGWQHVNTSFVVDADGYEHSSFAYSGLALPSVTANGSHIQTYKLALKTANPDAITDVRIRINADGPNAPQGYFAWRPSGFYERPGSDVGNEQVTLITEGPHASYRVIENDGVYGPIVMYYFNWTVDPSAGTTIGNSLRYSWTEMQYRLTGEEIEMFDTIVHTPALHITHLPPGHPLIYTPGEKDVTLTKISFDASASTEDVRVTGFDLDTLSALGLSPMDLEWVHLLVYHEDRPDETLWPEWTGGFNFFLPQPLVISAGTQSTIVVRADIGSDALPGTYTIGSEILDDVAAVGVVSGQVVDETMDLAGESTIIVPFMIYIPSPPSPPSISPILPPTPPVVLPPSTPPILPPSPPAVLPTPTVQVSIDSSNPDAQLFAAGTQGVTLATFNFYTTGPEDVEIESVYFTQRVTDPAMADYHGYDFLYLTDEAGIVVGSIVPTSTKPFIDVHENAVVVENGDTDGKKLYLKANLTNITPWSNVTVGGHQLGFNIAETADVKARGHMSGMESIITFDDSGDQPNGNTHRMYKGVPVYENIPLSGIPFNGGMNDLFKFRVSAVGGDIGLYKFTFDVTATGAEPNQFELYDVTNSSEVLLYSKPVLTHPTSGSGSYVFDVFLDDDTPEMSDVGREERVVAVGTPRTYVLRGVFTGVSTGDSVSTRMAGDHVGLSLMTSADVVDMESHNDFIWSDRHAVSHSTVTTDWTNGYLVSGLSAVSTSARVLSL